MLLERVDVEHWFCCVGVSGWCVARTVTTADVAVADYTDGASDYVPGHGHAGVDERKCGGVETGGEQGAVLREDVDGEGDGGGGVEVGEESGREGGRECVGEFGCSSM